VGFYGIMERVQFLLGLCSYSKNIIYILIKEKFEGRHGTVYRYKMKAEASYLIEMIRDTVDMFATVKPKFIASSNTLCVYWSIEHDADTMFDMFESPAEMDIYLKLICDSFEENFKGQELLISKGMGPTYNDGKMYASIYLQYQPILKDRDNIYVY
jgi:hypothetical protein